MAKEHLAVKVSDLKESSACLGKMKGLLFLFFKGKKKKAHKRPSNECLPYFLRAMTQAPNPEETSLMNFQEIRAGTAVIDSPEPHIFGLGNRRVSCALMRTLSSQVQEEEEKLN